MEHRQIWKNSLYEGSSRVPLFFVGPNIKKNVLYKNATSIIDILPTLIDIGGGEIPGHLQGFSLKPYMYEQNGGKGKHPDYIIAQYHSASGNTGTFMVVKDNYKYIQFGHYLTSTNKTLYHPQLFDLDKDPNEVKDISGDSKNQDLMQEMEKILTDNFNYEYVDCIAKQNDFMMFETYYWNLYNETDVMKKFESTYDGFNETDWQSVVDWRNLLKKAPSCEQTFGVE